MQTDRQARVQIGLLRQPLWEVISKGLWSYLCSRWLHHVTMTLPRRTTGTTYVRRTYDRADGARDGGIRGSH